MIHWGGACNNATDLDFCYYVAWQSAGKGNTETMKTAQGRGH